METIQRDPDNNAARLLAMCNAMMPEREQAAIVQAAHFEHADMSRNAEPLRRRAGYSRDQRVDMDKVS